jgi:hypothetical protein
LAGAMTGPAFSSPFDAPGTVLPTVVTSGARGVLAPAGAEGVVLSGGMGEVGAPEVAGGAGTITVVPGAPSTNIDRAVLGQAGDSHRGCRRGERCARRLDRRGTSRRNWSIR